MLVKRSTITTSAWILVLIVVGCMVRQTFSFSSVAKIVINRSSTKPTLYLSQESSSESSSSSSESSPSKESSSSESTPLIDLQTFLKLTKAVQSGGDAKSVIQGGICILNGEIETRRAKKLYEGDVVTFNKKTLDVSKEVQTHGYVYKTKKKKIKPVAKVIDAAGNLEFGGRYRSEEWRKERKERKTLRKNINSVINETDDEE
jgi:ribosome-associated protein